jgi:hypothetical protein
MLGLQQMEPVAILLSLPVSLLELEPMEETSLLPQERLPRRAAEWRDQSLCKQAAALMVQVDL